MRYCTSASAGDPQRLCTGRLRSPSNLHIQSGSCEMQDASGVSDSKPRQSLSILQASDADRSLIGIREPRQFRCVGLTTVEAKPNYYLLSMIRFPSRCCGATRRTDDRSLSPWGGRCCCTTGLPPMCMDGSCIRVWPRSP